MLCFVIKTRILPIGFYCTDPEKSILNGMSLEITRGRGVLKVKILEAKYEAKMEFPGEGGCKTKPSMGGEGVFSGTLCIASQEQSSG